MAGIRGAYVDTTKPYFAEDVVRDVATLLANDAAILLLVAGGNNALLTGCALSAGAGSTLNIAAGQVAGNGVAMTTLAGTATMTANSSGQTRVDAVYVQVLTGQPAGTDGTTGNALVSDTYALGIQVGTPGAGVPPTLPNANYVQVGTLTVPNGATTVAGCTLGSQVTAPNAIGPLKTLADLGTHIATVATSAVAVHGIQQGGGHGFDADTVDGTHGAGFDAAGAAATVQANLTTETTTRTNADTTLQTNVTGVQTNLSNHTAANASTGQAHGVMVQRGTTGSQTVVNQTEQGYTITFPVAFPGVPTVVASIAGTYGQQYGSQVLRQSVSATGATFNVGQTSGGNVGIALDWIAVYS